MIVTCFLSPTRYAPRAPFCGFFPCTGLCIKKTFVLSILGQKFSTSAVPPNLVHKNTPSLHTHHHALSLDNGRKSRWALLESLSVHLTDPALCSHLPKSIPDLFDCRNHTVCGSLQVSRDMYSSWSSVSYRYSFMYIILYS